MTKEEYLELRTKPEVPMELWHEFFLEKGGARIGLDDFIRLFTNMLLGVTILKVDGNQSFISLETALRAFYEHYNKKFEL